MNKDKPFFDTMHQLIDVMIGDEFRMVEPHHITTARIIAEAKQRGILVNNGKARRMIDRQVEAGRLVADGKRMDPEIHRLVSVWVVKDEPRP